MEVNNFIFLIDPGRKSDGWRTIGAEQISFRTEKEGKERVLKEIIVEVETVDHGKVRIEEYCREATAAIEEDGMLPLLQRINEYVDQNHLWLKTPKQRRRHSIDCLLNRTYEEWTDFK